MVVESSRIPVRKLVVPKRLNPAAHERNASQRGFTLLAPRRSVPLPTLQDAALTSRTPRFRGRRIVSAAYAFATLAACQPSRTASSDVAFRSSVAGVDWELMELNAKTASSGAGGRRATLRFDADSAHVAGFSGCNRFAGSYTLDGDSLRFGPLVMTRMACTQGMELERDLSAALEATRRYELSSTQLKLFGPSKAIARFSRQIPEAGHRPDT
jgi:heat shock protein HslJ